MPSSESVARKRQSVPDFFPESFAFMSFCLSRGDEPDRPLCLLDKDNDDHRIVEKPDSDLAFLAVPPPRIERDIHGAVEYGMNIREVNPVPPDIRSVLLLIPLNDHASYRTYTA